MPNITFSDPPVALTAARAELLPWNYLTPAFADMLNRAPGQARIMMALPNDGQPAQFATIAAETLKDPKATADFIAALDLDLSAGARRLFVGPTTTRVPTDPANNTPPELLPISGDAWSTVSARVFDQAVVIIDAGIAFWNARFRGTTGPRFRGVRYLDFDGNNLAQSKGLAEADIENLCQLADSQGSAAVLRRLAGDFPKSVFGTAANPDPEGFWHGTAVADLTGGAAMGTAENVALFGLELPREVIADYSGETLSAMLALILPAAIEMTAGFAGVPLTIVMPLGFPAGPQDGSHPAAMAIATALQMSGRQNVQVVVPAGNHLQDRCHAKLDQSGTRSVVAWDLAPDDYSANEVEIFGPAGAPLRLQVAGPGQMAVEASLPLANSYRTVLCDGTEIGILMRFDDAGPWSRTRLALWRTAPGASGAATPYGRWLIRSDGPDMLDLWLFRDDRDPMADRARPRRPSRFWSAGYSLRDGLGAEPLGDDVDAAVLRSGTLSVLATAASPAVVVVQADERLGLAAPVQATYSGRPDNGARVIVSVLVDDGWVNRGVAVAANGGQRRVRMSGTSAAAGIEARRLIGLGPAPLL